MSRKEFTVLRILASDVVRWWYGLEMIELSDGVLKRGTIYVTLNQMEGAGDIESRLEPELPPAEAHLRPRRQYRITHDGLWRYNEERAGGLVPT